MLARCHVEDKGVESVEGRKCRKLLVDPIYDAVTGYTEVSIIWIDLEETLLVWRWMTYSRIDRMPEAQRPDDPEVVEGAVRLRGRLFVPLIRRELHEAARIGPYWIPKKASIDFPWRPSHPVRVTIDTESAHISEPAPDVNFHPVARPDTVVLDDPLE